jgi:hypothetical protein
MGYGAVSIGFQTGRYSQGSYAVAIGFNAGFSNQSSNSISIGTEAGANSQASRSVSVGYRAGYSSQFLNTVAVGSEAGYSSQGSFASAVGFQAGYYNQGSYAVAIGQNSGWTNQGSQAVSIGYLAGENNQGNSSIGIGRQSARYSQGVNAIGLGFQSGYQNQGEAALAIGYNAGQYFQASGALSLGFQSGLNYQGTNALSIGFNSGYYSQGANAVAIGFYSGHNSQGLAAISIGGYAGFTGQGQYSSAIGFQSGYQNQQQYSTAIGYQSGYNNQAESSLAIGYQSAFNTQGRYATAVGYQSGYVGQRDSTVSLGYQAGLTQQATGAVSIGYQAGANYLGQYSVSIGYQTNVNALREQNIVGYSNVSVGNKAGYDNQADYAIALGYQSGYQRQSLGSLSVGYEAGKFNLGEYGVALGWQAGYGNQNESIYVAGGNTIGNLPAIPIQTVLANKPAWGIYDASNYNTTTNTWPDLSGNGRTATGGGVVTKSLAAGFGALSQVYALSGDTTANLTWPSGAVSSNFTICSISRFTGGVNKLVIQGSSIGNFAHGHTTATRGDVYYNTYLNSGPFEGNLTDWLVCCAKNNSTAPNNVLIDGVPRGTNSNSGTGGSGFLSINNSGQGQYSNWAISYIMIWNTRLTDAEMASVSTYLMNYLASGVAPLDSNYPLNSLSFSVDGINWNGLGKSVFTKEGYTSIYIQSLDKWFAVGDGTNAIATTTGRNVSSWTGMGNTVLDAGFTIANNVSTVIVGGTYKRLYLIPSSSQKQIRYSTNGINWFTSLQPSFPANDISVLYYTGNKWFCAWTNYNKIGISDDGFNWTLKDFRLAGTIRTTSINVAIYAENKLIVCSWDVYIGLFYSTDYGDTWSIYIYGGDRIYDIVYNPNPTGGASKWIINAYNWGFWSSNDLVTFNKVLGSNEWGDYNVKMLFVNNMYYCIRENSSSGIKNISYSSNGTTWTYANRTIGWCRVIRHNGSNMFVAAGTSLGNIAFTNSSYSYNGIDWVANIDNGVNYLDLHYDKTAGMWSAVGYSAGAYSYDGITWVVFPFTSVYFVSKSGYHTSESYNDTMAISTNGGTSFTAFGGTIFDGKVNGILYSKNNIWTAAGLGANTLAYSTDNGSTFTGIGKTLFSSAGYNVAFNGTDTWVAVGAGKNTVISSTDGTTTWTVRVPITFSTNANNIAYGGGKFVAVGSGTNTVVTTTDGLSWSALGTTIFSVAGNGVAYSGTTFVAVGEGTNSISYSTDAVTWTGLATTIMTIGNNVKYLNSLFFVLGSGTNTIAYSSNGSTGYTGLGTTIFSTRGKDVMYKTGGNYVFVGEGSNNSIVTTPNLSSWTGRGTVISKGYGIESNNSNLYIAGGSPDNYYLTAAANGIYKSTDGINWTVINSDGSGVLAYSYSTKTWAISKQKLISGINYYISYSTDSGNTWLFSNTLFAVESLCTNGTNLWLAGGGGSGMAKSTDAITWTLMSSLPSTTNNNYAFVSFAGGYFYVTGQYGGGSYYSSDLITWTLLSETYYTDFRSVFYSNGVWINRALNYSTNGINFIVSTKPSFINISEATYGEDKWVAVGSDTAVIPGSTVPASNTVLYSVDNGRNWIGLGKPISSGNAICWNAYDGIFVVLSGQTVVYSSN